MKVKEFLDRSRRSIGVRCFSLGMAVTYGLALPLPSAEAQDMPPSAAVAEDDENIYINFVREQLARSRQVAASETASPKKGNGTQLSPDAMTEEEQKILAQEAELLKELSVEASAPAPKEAVESVVDETVPTEQPSADTAKASMDVERAIEDKTEVSAPAPALTAEDDDFIEIVRPSNSKSESDSAPSFNSKSHTASRSSEEAPATRLIVDPTLQAKVTSQQQNIASLQRTTSDLRRKLEMTQKQLRERSSELEKSRNRLMIAETEVERLSTIIEQRNKTSLARFSGSAGPSAAIAPATGRSYPVPEKPAVVTKVSDNGSNAALSSREETPVKADMLVATVTAKKAYLRTGPGKNNSPLMSVGSGTRLAVETRQGDWYRVITPHGTRAWVASEVVAFGGNSSASPSRTIKVQGYGTK